VSTSGFVAAALQVLSVGLLNGNSLMHRASLGVLAGVAGWGFRPGADRPVEDVALLCLLSVASLACWILLL
jgi:hypothetical protein